MTDANKVRVAAMADLHVRERDHGNYRDLFKEISGVCDALVLAGDLTDLGKREEAEALAADLQVCTVPVVAVLGNHDFESGLEDQVGAILRQAGVRLLDGDSCEAAGVGFVGVKGFPGGFGPRMLSAFGEPALKEFVGHAISEAMRLENAMRQVKVGRTLVVLHYAPVADTIEGEPHEIYPFLGCSRLAETIDRFEVNAVVHGHAHRGRFDGRTPRGTPVYNVARQIEKPTGRPYALIDL